MKQLICPATGQLEIIDVSKPTIGPGELLLQLDACGVCGTDLMKVYSDRVAKPVQLGHEVVGTVAARSAGVVDFAEGQRVAVAHHVPDYSSHYTRRGSAPMDPHFKRTNIDPGGFAEFIRIPAQHVRHAVQPVPAAMPARRAVFMEPLACCLRALDRVSLVEGDSVLVVGVGAVGLLFVPLLCDRSITVLVTDLRPERLALADVWGAAAGFRADESEVAGPVREQTEGRGVDLVILTVVTEATAALALRSVRDGGRILLFGAKPGTMVGLDVWELWRREIDLVSSYSATPDLLPRAMAILDRPHYRLEETISHVFPLCDGATAFAVAHEGAASKVVIERA